MLSLFWGRAVINDDNLQIIAQVGIGERLETTSEENNVVIVGYNDGKKRQVVSFKW